MAPEDAGPFSREGALVLNCPGCGAQVADGTSICPRCDYIIDASFLSLDLPPGANDEEESTSASEDPRRAVPPARPVRTSGRTGSRPAVKGGASGSRPAVKTGSRPRVTTASGTSGSRPAAAPSPGEEEATQVKSLEELARDRPAPRSASRPASRSASRPASRPVPAARRAPEPPEDISEPEPEPEELEPPRALLPPAPPGRNLTATSQIVAPEEVLEDARAFVGGLTRSDKVAFAGASLLALSAFLPWKETAAEGEILGLMSLGFGAFLGALVVIGAIFVRVRRVMPHLHPLAPWMVQLGVSCFCILYTVVFIKLSFDSTRVPSLIGNAMIMNSSPSFGVFLALLGGLGALVGSLLGLRDRPA